MDFNENKGWKDKSNVGRRKEINEIINSKPEEFKNDLKGYSYDEIEDIISLNFEEGTLDLPGEYFVDIHSVNKQNPFQEEDAPSFDMVEEILEKHCSLLNKIEKHENKILKTKAKIKVLEDLLDKYYGE